MCMGSRNRERLYGICNLFCPSPSLQPLFCSVLLSLLSHTLCACVCLRVSLNTWPHGIARPDTLMRIVPFLCTDLFVLSLLLTFSRRHCDCGSCCHCGKGRQKDVFFGHSNQCAGRITALLRKTFAHGLGRGHADRPFRHCFWYKKCTQKVYFCTNPGSWGLHCLHLSSFASIFFWQVLRLTVTIPQYRFNKTQQHTLGSQMRCWRFHYHVIIFPP